MLVVLRVKDIPSGSPAGIFYAPIPPEKRSGPVPGSYATTLVELISFLINKGLSAGKSFFLQRWDLFFINDLTHIAARSAEKIVNTGFHFF